MAIKPFILIFIYGQLWWNQTSGTTKGPARMLRTAALRNDLSAFAGLNTKPFNSSYQASESKDPAKNKWEMPSAKPQLPITTKGPGQKGHKSSKEHLIISILIGIILLLMIVITVVIFLCSQWKRAASPLPHWAGRSPFADGDMPDLTATDKEPTQGLKRMSVLSLLPWKFNKDAQLLENAEGQLSESGQNLEAPWGTCDAAGTESNSSHAATATLDSSASTQTKVSEEPKSLISIPLQPGSPRPLALPPPSSWLSGVNGELCTIEPNSSEQNTEMRCSVPHDHSQQNVGETGQLPPPPEEFLSN